MKSLIFWFAFGMLSLVTAYANNAPVVSNVTAALLSYSERVVEVIYDVAEADNDTLTVRLSASSDGGTTWEVPVVTVSGVVGSGIFPGVHYQIRWDAGVDFGGHLSPQFRMRVIADDGHEPRAMVRVAAGSFLMGWTNYDFAVPEHLVSVPAFFMDVFEVTNGDYRTFCDATDRIYPINPDPQLPNYFTDPFYNNYPVVEVSWFDAKDYAAWADKRLPTEAEWERAANGAADNRRWPWGDTWSDDRANVEGQSDGYIWMAPVGAYAAGVSPTGCFDLAGNVWEWCEDDWHSNYLGAPVDGSAWIDSPRTNARILRGGAWNTNSTMSYCAYRSDQEHSIPTHCTTSYGFRCVSDHPARGMESSPLFTLDTRLPVPQPCANAEARVSPIGVLLTWSDPIEDTCGRPLTIDLVEIWMGEPDIGIFLTEVEPGTGHFDYVKTRNGCQYCLRALAGDYYGEAVCVGTDLLCDSLNRNRNMALECGAASSINQVGGSSPALAIDGQALDAWYTESATGTLVIALPTRCSLDSLILFPAMYPTGSAQRLIRVSPDSLQWHTLTDSLASWSDGQRWVVSADGLDTIRYIAVITTNSVCYVGWYEVEAWGAPVRCRAVLTALPSTEIQFGTTLCDGEVTRTVRLVNSTEVPAHLLGFEQSTSGFHPDSALIGTWIAPMSEATLTIQLVPMSEGIVRDTLNVISQLEFPDTLRIPLAGIVSILPVAPESLVVVRGESNNIDLAWAPVTLSVCGHPIIPRYRVYGATTLGGPYTQIGVTAANIFVHPFVINGQSTHFYRVAAIEGMVYVPAGPYVMGSDFVGGNSVPEHVVNVSAFYMDIYEISNAEYKAFCDATGRAYPPDQSIYGEDYFTNPVYANYPAVVDWNGAHDFAAWAGKRLPSEAEWERAAKGCTGNQLYPWGNSWVGSNANIVNNPADGYVYTAPVGSYPGGISPVGCFDMAGNVYEWCEDVWHETYIGAPTDGSAWTWNQTGWGRVCRGGSCQAPVPGEVGAQCAYRYHYSEDNNYTRGFRCVKTP